MRSRMFRSVRIADRREAVERGSGLRWDPWPSKWSMKASSCTFWATTRPDQARPCGIWQTSNRPSPSAASMSATGILDFHGQRRRKIGAVRCASPSWAVAIGPERDLQAHCAS